jgi:hypothetical protein
MPLKVCPPFNVLRQRVVGSRLLRNVLRWPVYCVLALLLWSCHLGIFLSAAVVALPLSRCADSIYGCGLLWWTLPLRGYRAFRRCCADGWLANGCELVVVETGKLQLSMMRRCNFSMTGVFSRRVTSSITGGGRSVMYITIPDRSVGLALSTACGGGQHSSVSASTLVQSPELCCALPPTSTSQPWLIPDPVIGYQR